MEISKTFIQQQLAESIAVKQKMADEQSDSIAQISQALIKALGAGGIIYLCGNGGSAADAQHVATELVGRYLRERKALPAVALTTDTSLLTALANDYEFSRIFARQVEALVTAKDVVVGISTSGKSENVIEAIKAARQKGAFTIGFTGSPGLPLSRETNLCLCVPSRVTPRIQESHITAWHIICDLIEQTFAK